MPKPKKGRRLGANPSHQRLLMSGLATQLFEHGRITTTEAKARFLRPIAEKLITKAKKAELGTVASLHQRREVLKVVRDKSVVHTLFTEIGPSFAERPGGYTRITKLGPRKGDNAPMAVIELVTEAYQPKATTARRTAPVPAKPAAAEETPADVEPGEPGETDVEVAELADVPTGDSADEAASVGSHAPLEDADEAPEGFPVKGNRDSMKFHEPDGQWYGQTTAEVWFDTAESAEAAGFTRAGD